jgi:hypothetical protein
MARPVALPSLLAPKSRTYVWMATVSPSVAHQRYNLTFFGSHKFSTDDATVLLLRRTEPDEWGAGAP